MYNKNLDDYMENGQKKILLPGTFMFIPKTADHVDEPHLYQDNVTEAELEKLVDFYWERAQADPTVMGILGFSWNSIPGIQEDIPNGVGGAVGIKGILHMPGLLNKWNQKGAEVINY